MAFCDKVRCGHTCGLEVVDGDMVDGGCAAWCGASVITDHHQAAAHSGLKVPLIDQRRNDDHAPYLMCQQVLKKSGLFVFIAVCVSQQDPVAVAFLRCGLNFARNVTIHRIGDAGYQQTQHRRVAGFELLRSAIGSVIEFSNGLVHPAQGINTHALCAAVEHVRDGTDGDARPVCNVGDGTHRFSLENNGESRMPNRG